MQTASGLANKVTIVVSPRERHYAIIPSLLSLFSTIGSGVKVVVVQGDLPPDVANQLRELNHLRPFDLIAPPYPLYPQEARNLGIARCSSEFVVIADNDIEYEPGWLEAIVSNAENTGADLVAPLIFIGPPRAAVIHHAGGRITFSMTPDGLRTVEEHHQFMNKSIGEVDVSSLGIDNEVVEFHCFLARKSFLDRLGGLDERLITREQIDYGLRARLLGAKVTFEPAARVTYMAKKAFGMADLAYLSFRWNDAQAIEAMTAFENNWGIHIDKNRVLNTWIRKHRARAYGTFFTKQYASMPLQQFYTEIVIPQETAALQRAAQLRGKRKPAFIAEKPDSASAERTLQAFAAA